ncbi:hypothetical protein Salat_0194800 [Sesamum alatum]|uniref:Uncharacterized protein n=1 Tax=Sesamum alatum TaxID=300844 RepID=A0AAE2CXX9_9LAMI|nr:hypothetical protein Salat_0194800 [Sesamum alatum]
MKQAVGRMDMQKWTQDLSEALKSFRRPKRLEVTAQWITPRPKSFSTSPSPQKIVVGIFCSRAKSPTTATIVRSPAFANSGSDQQDVGGALAGMGGTKPHVRGSNIVNAVREQKRHGALAICQWLRQPDGGGSGGSEDEVVPRGRG